MKINVTAEILDLDGNPIPEKPPGVMALAEPKVANKTLRSVATLALLEPLRGDENLAGDKKARLWTLAMRVHNEDYPDLDLDDVKLIRDRIDLAFPPLVVGRCREILDPKPAAAAPAPLRPEAEGAGAQAQS